MIGVAGHAIGPEGEDHLRPMHADRLDDTADEPVEIGLRQVTLAVVEHAQDAHAQEGDRASQLVLPHRVEVAPHDRVVLHVAILAARSRRLLEQPAVEGAAGHAQDDDVRAGCSRTGDRATEAERLVAWMRDHHHEAARGVPFADRPPDGGHGRQYIGLGAGSEAHWRVGGWLA